MSTMKDKLAASVRQVRDAQKPAAKSVASSSAKPVARATAKPVAKSGSVKAAATDKPAKADKATTIYAGGIADSRNQLFPSRVWPD